MCALGMATIWPQLVLHMPTGVGWLGHVLPKLGGASPHAGLIHLVGEVSICVPEHWSSFVLRHTYLPRAPCCLCIPKDALAFSFVIYLYLCCEACHASQAMWWDHWALPGVGRLCRITESCSQKLIMGSWLMRPTHLPAPHLVVRPHVFSKLGGASPLVGLSYKVGKVDHL